MQTIDNQGLIKLLKANPDIAYVATATTPWHAIGVVASVLSHGLEDKRGIVIISILGSYGKPLINASNFRALGDNVDIYVSKKNHNKIQTIFNIMRFITSVHRGNRIISVISSHNINLHAASAISLNINNIKANLIKYDEGLATYFPQKVESIPNIITRLSIVINKLFVRLYSIFHTSSNACLFFQKKCYITTNNNIIPFYKQAIDLAAKESSINTISQFEDSIIICPNAWRREEVEDNADTKIILRLLEYLYNNHIKFVVKLHPRDTWSKDIYIKYANYIYDTPGVSMESILSSVKTPPKVLIGFSSTVLVTAKLFWDLKTVNIADIVDNSKLGKMYWNEKYYFTKIFSCYVSSPLTLDKLYKLIEE